jgi:hypothetical protein
MLPASPMDLDPWVFSGSKQLKWGAFRRMAGGYKICMEMYGNGVWMTGTNPIMVPQQMVAPGCLVKLPRSCCAAALGASTPSSAVRPTATGTTRTTAVAVLVSASVASPRTCFFTLNPFISLHWLLAPKAPGFFHRVCPFPVMPIIAITPEPLSCSRKKKAVVRLLLAREARAFHP